MLGAVCGALGAALLTSKLLWGYFVTLPGLDARIANAREYTSLTKFRSHPEGGRTAAELVIEERRSPEQLLSYLREEPYDSYHLIVLQHLERRGVLRALRPIDSGRLAALLPLIRSSGVLATPDAGYEGTQYLNGVIVEAVEDDGTRLLYIGALGGEVSNDHHPNYQFLFEGTPDGSWRLAASTRYFTDVAGIEGLEWPVLFIIYLPFSFALCGVIALLGWQMRRKRTDDALLRPQGHQR